MNEEKPECTRKGRTGWKIIRVLAYVFLGFIVAALFALIFGFAVKWLWNLLMPAIFGLRPITYWQAFGLLLLAKLLFGRFGHQGPSQHYGPRFKKGFSHRHGGRFRRHDHWGEWWREPGGGPTEGVGNRASGGAQEPLR